MDNNKPDICIISETWCSENIDNCLLNIAGYYIGIRIDRHDTQNGIGGGILIYVKNELFILPVDNDSDFNQFCHFKVLSNSTDCIDIIAIYRSPNSSSENNDKLCDLIDNLGSGNFFICGDLNFRNICWTTNTADAKGRRFLESTENKFFEQLIDFPTHRQGGILDILLTNVPDTVLNIEDIGPLSNSDHSAISVDIMFNAKYNDSSEKVLNWNKANISELQNTLRSVNWVNVFEDKDTSEMWNIFTNKIEEAVHKYVPTRKRRQPGRPVWMTDSLLRLTRRKSRAWKTYRGASGDNKQILHARYLKLQKQCKKAIRKAKNKLEKKLSLNNNKRPFQSYIKSKTKNKSKVGPLKVNGNLISDNQGMSTVLNDYFSSVFTREDETNIPTANKPECNSVLSNLKVYEEDIIKKIDNLKASSAPGNDKISPTLLKECQREVASP